MKTHTQSLTKLMMRMITANFNSHNDRLHTFETQSLSVDQVLITPNDFLVINGGRQKTSEKVIARNNMLLRTVPKQQSNNERFKERLQWVFF
mmetsp:Transcript_28426/g.34683  ORF Transcript_28426/g.34683 Transcript_28426/m.34683 type:complete len:92 (-) Transcript_28426:769-1044(-)